MTNFAYEEIIPESGDGNGLVLLCEHAGRVLPKGDLGIGEHLDKLHMLEDRGAREIAEGVQRALNAPLLMGKYSRLYIDVNREIDRPGFVRKWVPYGKNGTCQKLVIPDNNNVPENDMNYRKFVHSHFHKRLDELVGNNAVLVSFHTTTPEGWVVDGTGAAIKVRREYDISFLFDKDDEDARIMAKYVGRTLGQYNISYNQPPECQEVVKELPTKRFNDLKGVIPVFIEVNERLVLDEAGNPIKRKYNIVAKCIANAIKLYMQRTG